MKLLAVFDLVPGWVWAAAVGVLCVLVLASETRVLDARADASYAKLALEKYRAEVAHNTAKLEREFRSRETQMRLDMERISNDATKKQAILVGRIAAADRSAGSLRDEIARLNARGAPADPVAAGYADEARTARELLGTCSREYRTVAEDADRLRDQVTGLQDYVNSVQSK